jgi:hypothetical protein
MDARYHGKDASFFDQDGGETINPAKIKGDAFFHA